MTDSTSGQSGHSHQLNFCTHRNRRMDVDQDEPMDLQKTASDELVSRKDRRPFAGLDAWN